MAKFSQAFLRQAASPGMFGLGVAGLGSQLGTALQERRQREEQMQAQQQQMTLMNQSIAAAEQGDTRALTANRNKIMELLSVTEDQATRDSLMDTLNQLNAARPAAQKQAITNTANAIIKTEEALKQFNESTEPMTNEQYMQRAKVQGALEERLAVMKQNGQAVIEADNIKYQTKFAKYQRQNKLAEQQEIAAERALGAVPFEGEDYKAIRKELTDQGMGNAVSRFEKVQYELIEAKDKADQIRESTAPLTKKEEQTLIDNGHKPTGNIRLDRRRLALIQEVRDKAIIVQANRRIGGVTDPKAHVQATLDDLMEYGDLPLNFINSDLYNKIEDLTDEQIQQLADTLKRPAGEELTANEIKQRVIDFISKKFPEQWQDATTFRQNIADDVEDVRLATNAILQDEGINPEEATPEQLASAQRQAEIELAIAEKAVARTEAPAAGGQGRRERRGESVRIENMGIERRTGVGGQMNRRNP